MDLTKIAQNVVKKIPSKEEVKLESFWADSDVVIIFLRRFGCMFCRQSAKEISALTPLLQSNNVRLIGIGLEELGLDEFVQGEYFNGELYLDEKKQNYKDIGYKTYNSFTIFMSIFSKTSRDAIAKARAEGTAGNLKGDTLQNGGTLVVSKGGEKVLLDYRQENPADHVANVDILKALGITDPNAAAAGPNELETKPAE